MRIAGRSGTSRCRLTHPPGIPHPPALYKHPSVTTCLGCRGGGGRGEIRRICVWVCDAQGPALACRFSFYGTDSFENKKYRVRVDWGCADGHVCMRAFWRGVGRLKTQSCAARYPKETAVIHGRFWVACPPGVGYVCRYKEAPGPGDCLLLL